MKKKSIILYINTSDNKKIEVAILADGKKISKTAENNWTSQMLLPLIEDLLKANKIELNDLTEIKVHTGPGSYTGLRVGVTVANTLSYLLKIPINGKKSQIVIPTY